ncbi:MAG: Coenzyme F420 hydrogenase/dehydrogenase, beta subunit C-terminal domain [Nanoarchaeota archaeon]
MIAQVVKDNLCMQCGMCAGVCPNDNIQMEQDRTGEWYPVVGGNCSHCGKCVNSCAGWEVNFNLLNKEIFGKIPNDVYIGNFKKCYIGYSKDKKIRMESSSGGIVTSIGIYLLENRLVDGVVVVVDSKDPLHPKPIIARNKKDMINAMQSKYVSIPVNIMIKQILKEKGKFAFVGQPCQIHSIRKAERIDKRIKEKIIYKIGIFCEYRAKRDYLTFLAKKSGLDLKRVIGIKYREGNWPGNLQFRNTKIKKEFPITEYLYYPLTIPFIDTRCLKCIDHTNELADISVGDAWCLNKSGEQGGWAVVIDRNDLASKDLLKGITTKIISKEKINTSQKKPLSLKKEGYIHRSKFFLKLPVYENSLPTENLRVKMENLLIFLLIFFKKIRLFQLFSLGMLRKYLRIVLKNIQLTKR